MAVSNRRSRMISFRLSEQEYEGLLNLCSVSGARSLSDLTRSTVQSLLPGGENHGLATVVKQLQARMTELDLEVKQLAQLVVAQKGISSAESQ